MDDALAAGPLRAFRPVRTSRGFTFCDDDDDEDDNISEEQPLHAQQHAVPPPELLLLPAALEPLILAGVEASSTDNPEQSIACTLSESGLEFWSSSGSQSPDASEYLLFKLRSPLCLVRYVDLTVFRAQYQFGEPVYPPRAVSFQAGPSPWAMAPPTVKFPVAATAAVQTFPLPATQPLGRYLRVNLLGKRQQQLEDMQWYHAVQRVEAYGHRLPAAGVARLHGWLRSRLRPLPAPGVVPGCVAPELGCLAVGLVQQQEHEWGDDDDGEEQQQQGQGQQQLAHPARPPSGGSIASSLSFVG